jgi:hypothetical protein
MRHGRPVLEPHDHPHLEHYGRWTEPESRVFGGVHQPEALGQHQGVIVHGETGVAVYRTLPA